MNQPLRLCLWSGPRNVSTAMMYSFAQRNDTRILDEPLYAHYLRVSGAEHPGAAEVLAAMDQDGERVVREVILGPCDQPVLFMKQMAHHLVDLDWGFMCQTTNVLLVRDPVDMLPSLAKNLAHGNPVSAPTLRDTGLGMQSRLRQHLRDRGQDPLVLDARELLLNPANVLQQLCHRLDIPFQTAMLQWPAGSRPEDGVWAKYWYHNLHRSTGFQLYEPKSDPFPDHLKQLLAECQPHYDILYQVALKAP